MSHAAGDLPLCTPSAHLGIRLWWPCRRTRRLSVPPVAVAELVARGWPPDQAARNQLLPESRHAGTCRLGKGAGGRPAARGEPAWRWGTAAATAMLLPPRGRGMLGMHAALEVLELGQGLAEGHLPLKGDEACATQMGEEAALAIAAVLLPKAALEDYLLRSGPGERPGLIPALPEQARVLFAAETDQYKLPKDLCVKITRFQGGSTTLDPPKQTRRENRQRGGLGPLLNQTKGKSISLS